MAVSSPKICFALSELANAMRLSIVVWCSLIASRNAFVAASASSPLAMASFYAWAAFLVSADAEGAA